MYTTTVSKMRGCGFARSEEVSTIDAICAQKVFHCRSGASGER
jgi:hypothetical protein